MGQRSTVWRAVWRSAVSLLAVAALLAGVALLWLYLDSHRERGDWFDERQGRLAKVDRSRLPGPPGLVDERMRFTSSSSLTVTARVVRPAMPSASLPLVLLLGGHRTGSDAVTLFSDVGERAIAAFDYPYDGPLRTTGTWETLGTLPAVRRASLDIAPAISLALEWLLQQSWVDPDRVTMVGVSLGVPFATTAAARDSRIKALLLVHGAADNRRWIDHNLERRVAAGPLQPLLATLANWAIYGSLHDTGAQLSRLSPRPVMIVGARNDERVPKGETEALFAAAREPKSLNWTDGLHITPTRRDVLNDLMELGDSLVSPRDPVGQ